MGSSKNDIFTVRQNELAELAKAIAHPARVAILDVLMESPGCICGDIVDKIPLAQSTISQHLKAMKSSGLISGTVDGPKVCYCINSSKLEMMKSLFGQFLTYSDKDNSCC